MAQLPSVGSDQGNIGHTVSLLSQYMASGFGTSDFAPANPVTEPQTAFPDQMSFLASAPLAHSQGA
jgi:hypothetical protein